MSPRGRPAPDLRAEVRPLYAFVASRVGRNRSLAEDLTQETLLAAVQGTFDPGRGMLRAWLFGIALRKICDHERRKRVSSDHLPELARELADRMSREPLPDEWLLRDEVRGVVNEALSRLPEASAALLIRKYFEGASVAHLASDLGLGEKAVESQLTRARAALQETLERLGRHSLEVGP